MRPHKIERGAASMSFSVAGPGFHAVVWSGRPGAPSEAAARRNAVKVAAVPLLLDIIDQLARMEADRADIELRGLIRQAQRLKERMKD